jgi:hypothetical protein
MNNLLNRNLTISCFSKKLFEENNNDKSVQSSFKLKQLNDNSKLKYEKN